MARQDYGKSGFNGFFNRSIGAASSDTLPDAQNSATRSSRELNYDQVPTTGSLGSVVQIGDNITLDGPNVRISMYEKGVEMLRIGKRDG